MNIHFSVTVKLDRERSVVLRGHNSLQQCFSKQGPGNSTVSITWEADTDVNSEASSQAWIRSSRQGPTILEEALPGTLKNTWTIMMAQELCWNLWVQGWTRNNTMVRDLISLRLWTPWDRGPLPSEMYMHSTCQSFYLVWGGGRAALPWRLAMELSQRNPGRWERQARKHLI